MKPAPALSRGDTVEVREDNRRPWRGEVLSVKGNYPLEGGGG